MLHFYKLFSFQKKQTFLNTPLLQSTRAKIKALLPSLLYTHTHTHASMHTPPAQHKTQNLPVAQSKVHYAIPCSNQDPKGERKRENLPPPIRVIYNTSNLPVSSPLPIFFPLSTFSSLSLSLFFPSILFIPYARKIQEPRLSAPTLPPLPLCGAEGRGWRRRRRRSGEKRKGVAGRWREGRVEKPPPSLPRRYAFDNTIYGRERWRINFYGDQVWLMYPASSVCAACADCQLARPRLRGGWWPPETKPCTGCV